MSDSTTTASTAPDWTMGGKKPEREGQRCANEECGQILMFAPEGRTHCARCDVQAGRDPHAWSLDQRATVAGPQEG